MVNIIDIVYYLPERNMTNDLLSQRFPEWSVHKIGSKTGISNRHISGVEEFSSDLAVAAAEKLFEKRIAEKDKVDFLLLCTQSPDYFLPTTACIVQDRLGLPTTAGALDFNLGCSGFVYGLSLAQGLICSGSATNVLLITSETYSKFIHPEDKGNLTIFGDAAAACLISKESGLCSMDHFVFGTDGSGAENLIVKRGGLRFPKTPHSDKEDLDSGNYLYMNGPEIFSFTIKAVPKLIQQTLNKASLKIDDIDLFVFHQANRYMLEHLRKKIGIPEEKFFIFMENCGNTVSSTIPIALKEAIDMGRIRKGDKVLLAGFGVGYSWAGCILQF